MRLRALMVGLGGVGQRHVRNLRQLMGDDVDLVAYRVRKESAVLSDALTVTPDAELEQRYGIRAFGELSRALAEKPNFAIVANPTSLHVGVALEAARAGCDLFLEKPVSHDLTGLGELSRIARDKGLMVSVGYQLRKHPGFSRLRSWLDKGRVGSLFAARFEVGEYLPGFHPYEDYRRMYASRADQGGGVTLTQIHEIDLALALFGMPRRVFSVGGRYGSLDIDVEDVAVSILENTRADGRPLPIALHQDYLSRPKRRGASFAGDRGRIDWRLDDGTLTLWGTDGNVVEKHDDSAHPRNQLFLDELSEFLTAVRTRRPAGVSLDEGVASLRIALALRASQASGKPAVPKEL
ncbi:MAG: Gfo/Idh/MocA family oxidoreductase [Myxococcales bacterium]|nr:Gfo/Idh/MocA family oxidoreductase [Myxococcales bacterium]MCB9579369.1 Gfo/Idh/MocA family oxidoreductase [Polyangiaceae bacterium]